MSGGVLNFGGWTVWWKIRGSSGSDDGGWSLGIENDGRGFYRQPRIIVGCSVTGGD